MVTASAFPLDQIGIYDFRSGKRGSGSWADVQDQSRLKELVEWWYDKKPDDGLWPDKDAVLPDGLPHHLPHIVFTRVLQDGEDFLFAVLGGHIDERMGRKKAGQTVSALHGLPEISAMARAYEITYQSGVPSIFFFDYEGPSTAITGTEELFLPFAGAEGRLGYILTLVNFLDDHDVYTPETRWQKDEANAPQNTPKTKDATR